MVRNPAIPAARVRPWPPFTMVRQGKVIFCKPLRRVCWRFSSGVNLSTATPWATLSNDQMERARTVDDGIGHQMAIEGCQLPSMGASEGKQVGIGHLA